MSCYSYTLLELSFNNFKSCFVIESTLLQANFLKFIFSYFNYNCIVFDYQELHN